MGDSIYDDVVPWNRAAAQYRPRTNAVEQPLNKSVGKYLEEPALHYTAGTKVTKRVADRLGKHGITSAFVHADPIAMEPEMVRGVLGTYSDPDWRTRLSGFYTADAFQKALNRGLSSDTASTSYIPSLTTTASVFGRGLGTTGKYGRST
jgi:hypothetical protein